MTNNRLIRKLSGQMLKGYLGQAVLLLFILKAATTVPSLLIDVFCPESVIASSLYNMYTLAVGGAFKFGTAIFFLSLIRGNCLGLNSIGYGFDYFGKAFVIYINIVFRAMIAGIFFVIPGIIVILKYSQAFYILADAPEKSVYECLNESRFIMAGKSGKYIALLAGFIPLYILANIPDFIATQRVISSIAPAAVMDMQAMLEVASRANASMSLSPWRYLTLFLFIAVDALRNAATAVFYDVASGKLVFENEQD